MASWHYSAGHEQRQSGGSPQGVPIFDASPPPTDACFKSPTTLLKDRSMKIPVVRYKSTVEIGKQNTSVGVVERAVLGFSTKINLWWAYFAS